MERLEERASDRKREATRTVDGSEAPYGELRSSEVHLVTSFGRISARGPELIAVATLLAMIVWSLASAGDGPSQDLLLIGATGVVLFVVAVLARRT